MNTRVLPSSSESLTDCYVGSLHSIVFKLGLQKMSSIDYLTNINPHQYPASQSMIRDMKVVIVAFRECRRRGNLPVRFHPRSSMYLWSRSKVARRRQGFPER